MVLASFSQLAPSSGVVAAIWPRICKPVRKSARLKAASASLRSVAADFADRPRLALDLGLQLDRRIRQVVALEGLVGGQRRKQPKRQRGANEDSADETGHDGAPSADERRGTVKNARKGDSLMATGRLAKGRLAKRSQQAWLWQSKWSQAGAGGVRPAQALGQRRATGNGPPSGFVANMRKSVRTTWRGSGFFIMAVLERPLEGQVFQRLAEYRPDGPIAQLDRVTDFYSVGCRFESCWDRQIGTHQAIENKRTRGIGRRRRSAQAEGSSGTWGRPNGKKSRRKAPLRFCMVEST